MKASTKITTALVALLIAALAAGAAVWLTNRGDPAADSSKLGAAHAAGPFQVQVNLDPEKPRVGRNRLTVIVRDADGKPVEGARIDALAEMPAMGSMPAMRAPADVAETEPGRYSGEFELSMDGAWPLSLAIASAAQGSAELQFDLTTSRAGLRLTSATPSTLATPAKPTATGTDSGDGVATTGPYRVHVRIEPDPPKVGKNSLTVIVQDESGEPVRGAQVRAVAQMPAMGSMPAMNAPAEVTEVAPGRYQGELELSMSGEWPLAVDVHSDALGHGDLTFDMATGRKGLGLATATPGDISHYTCSMHPSVKSATPGTCPICAMDLVPVTKQEVQSGSVMVDARRRQLIGVTTGVVKRKPLSQIIRAAGEVTYDETRLSDISLKFDGWIGELYADYVSAPVKKGETLFTVYSPELVSAQDEYLETLRRRPGSQDSLLAAARRRLSLWDIGSGEIRALEKRGRAVEYLPIRSPASGTVIEKHIVEGTAVKAGMQLLRIADLSHVWVEGQIYEYELPHVQVGMAATVVLPEMPGQTFPTKVTYVFPYLEGDTRTARVRVELPNPDGLLRPDMYAHVHLNVDLGERLVVPEGAVLYAGESRVVFLDLGEGRLQPRKIKTGLRSGDDIEVLEGLRAGDRVVTSGNFLIAAESKLKAGIDQW